MAFDAEKVLKWINQSMNHDIFDNDASTMVENTCLIGRRLSILPKSDEIYWGTKVWNININFVVFKKINKRLTLKTHV